MPGVQVHVQSGMTFVSNPVRPDMCLFGAMQFGRRCPFRHVPFMSICPFGLMSPASCSLASYHGDASVSRIQVFLSASAASARDSSAFDAATPCRISHGKAKCRQ